jgi:hypothetical protein
MWFVSVLNKKIGNDQRKRSISADGEEEVSAIYGKFERLLLVKRDGISFHVNRQPTVGDRSNRNKTSLEFMRW